MMRYLDSHHDERSPPYDFISLVTFQMEDYKSRLARVENPLEIARFAGWDQLLIHESFKLRGHARSLAD
jgi:hypothetical protein